MTQVQTIGGLKRGRGRGRGAGRGTGRGRGGRSNGKNDKSAAFEAFKGSGCSLSAKQTRDTQQQQNGSGVFSAEQQHLAGVARLQQQHEEALGLRAVQLAELQKQQQEQQQATTSERSISHLEASTSAGCTHAQPHANSIAATSSVIDLCDDNDEAAQLSQNALRPPAKPREKVAWSLGVKHATSSAATPASSGGGDNPFWCPSRYVPVGGENQPDLRLQTNESALVLDSGLVGHRATAVLDTGNAGHTLITRSFARQLALVDVHGNPTQAYSRTIRVQGVVAGAFEMIKTLNITYEIKGKKMHITAGLTEARLGCDLLISRREIAEFESDGYRLSAR